MRTLETSFLESESQSELIIQELNSKLDDARAARQRKQTTNMQTCTYTVDDLSAQNNLFELN